MALAGAAGIFSAIHTDVSSPVYSLADGVYHGSQSVEISSSISGSNICYTTDGSIPSCSASGGCISSTLYTTVLTLSDSATVNAIGCKSNAVPSAVTSGIYTIFSITYDAGDSASGVTQNLTLPATGADGIPLNGDDSIQDWLHNSDGSVSSFYLVTDAGPDGIGFTADDTNSGRTYYEYVYY